MMKLNHALLVAGLLFVSGAWAVGNDPAPTGAGASYLIAQAELPRDRNAPDSDQRNLTRDRDDNSRSSGNSGPSTSGASGKRAGPDTAVCPGEFALCASSTCRPTGRMITVKEKGGTTTKQFPESVCTCPVITAEIAQQNGVPLVGVAALNEGNMDGSCKSPGPGKIWSYFSTITVYPQESATPAFSMQMANQQTCPAGSKGTNCWSYLCEIDAKETNGARTATCSCPFGESLFGAPEGPQAPWVTFAGGYSSNPSAACSMYPVGFQK